MSDADELSRAAPLTSVEVDKDDLDAADAEIPAISHVAATRAPPLRPLRQNRYSHAGAVRDFRKPSATVPKLPSRRRACAWTSPAFERGAIVGGGGGDEADAADNAVGTWLADWEEESASPACGKTTGRFVPGRRNSFRRPVPYAATGSDAGEFDPMTCERPATAPPCMASSSSSVSAGVGPARLDVDMAVPRRDGGVSLGIRLGGDAEAALKRATSRANTAPTSLAATPTNGHRPSTGSSSTMAESRPGTPLALGDAAIAALRVVSTRSLPSQRTKSPQAPSDEELRADLELLRRRLQRFKLKSQPEPCGASRLRDLS